MAALASACAVYDADGVERPSPPGTAGAAGAGPAGAGGTGGGASDDDSGGAGTGAGGSHEEEDGSAPPIDATIDHPKVDVDATSTDTTPPFADALPDNRPDEADVGPDEDGSTDASADARDASDGSSRPDSEGGTAVADAADAFDVAKADADAKAPDVDAPSPDATDGGSTLPRQILPLHGTAIVKPDAGGPFQSRCAADEVVTGFIARAGVQTDAIASTCSKLSGGVLSSPRNLPLNGNPSGGNPVTVSCPSNYVAVGIVGRYGYCTMWKENVTNAVGVVCRSLSSSSTQVVTITGQPALDPGYTSFREDCTSGRYLTALTGITDTNSLSYCVQQVGGECEVR